MQLSHTTTRLSEVALGGTAVGTGIATHTSFACRVLGLGSSRELDIELAETSNHFQAQSSIGRSGRASGTLKAIAVSL